MAYVKLASLAVFLLATSLMFPMKKVEAVDCSGVCSPFQMPPCGSTDCRCIPWGLFAGQCINPIGGVASFAKMIDEHPNLCQSNDECMKKGSGNFCARYPNPHIEYGWCINSYTEALKSFLKMPTATAEFHSTLSKLKALNISPPPHSSVFPYRRTHPTPPPLLTWSPS
ncbi:Albumin-1 protein [Spatholobus suberectus]|nr:Albumin-1 protein [Spatholobus suberectus]